MNNELLGRLHSMNNLISYDMAGAKCYEDGKEKTLTAQDQVNEIREQWILLKEELIKASIDFTQYELPEEL